MRKLRLVVVILLAVTISAALSTYLQSSQQVRIRVTTTTSLYATGLLDYLAEKFSERVEGVSFDFIPVGSGEALRRAELGDACMVFVHAPSLEKEYVSRGIIASRHIFAYNYFIIAGPSLDPAEIKSSESPVDAFTRIYRAGEEGKAVFVSRGDSSGTHVKELSLWREAGLDPRGRPWYKETGSGMSQTLLVANEKEAYVLSDIGTYLKFRKEGKIPNLELLYEGGVKLINIYSAYIVASCEDPEKSLALKFMDFISSDAQPLIARYGVEKFGKPLFNAADDEREWLENTWEMLAGF